MEKTFAGEKVNKSVSTTSTILKWGTFITREFEAFDFSLVDSFF